METADLIKTLLKAEEECRELRVKVAELEKTHRLRERDSHALMATPSEDGGSRRRSNGRKLSLPIEVVGQLMSKTGDVTLLLKKNKKLLKERKQLQEILQVTAADTEQAKLLNAELKQRIGYNEGESMIHLKHTANEASKLNGLKYEVLQALRARETIQATLKRQTEYMRAYALELAASKELDEQRNEAQQQLSEKKQALERLRVEVRKLKRNLEEKDKKLENEKPVDELELTQQAENDRRTVLYKLEKEEECRRQDEISIRHRSMQIAKLERRIEMIGDALGGDEASEENRVDAELVDALRKEIVFLERLHQKHEAQQELLDTDIASQDRRCIGLVRTTASTMKEMDRIARNHWKYTNLQKKQLEMEQMAAEEEMGEIEQEIEMLRRTTARRAKKAQRV